MAGTQQDAGWDFEHCGAGYEAKYEKAVQWLVKDRQDLPAIYE